MGGRHHLKAIRPRTPRHLKRLSLEFKIKMRPTDETFEKLDVWKRSHAMSVELYRLLEHCRDWGFKDQITRAANSIADNIAEGSERPGKAEYRVFIGYARGSAGEARSQMLRAKALQYISEPDANRLVDELIEISRMLRGLYKSMA